MTNPPSRHPGGRTCGEMLPLVLLLMPYFLLRHALDSRRARKGKS